MVVPASTRQHPLFDWSRTRYLEFMPKDNSGMMAAIRSLNQRRIPAASLVEHFSNHTNRVLLTHKQLENVVAEAWRLGYRW